MKDLKINLIVFITDIFIKVMMTFIIFRGGDVDDFLSSLGYAYGQLAKDGDDEMKAVIDKIFDKYS